MAKLTKNYRLGIDLGSTSLGWCMLELDENNDPKGIINMGVRISPDGRDLKTREPLAVSRRGYRGQRRNLDRYLQRVRELIIYLMANGFLPEDERSRSEVFKINPYYLRATALAEPLSPAEFARALIHLAKRRGFRSNRKVLSDKTTKTSEAIENLRTALRDEGAKTLGEYMWNLYNQNSDQPKPAKLARHGSKKYAFKLGQVNDRPIKFRYEKNYENPIFPTRDMVEDEFDKIWAAQSRFNANLTDEHRDRIRNIIFHQRPLKPTEKGKCEFESEEYRAPIAHPLFQEFRLRQSLNHMLAIDADTGETSKLSDDQYKLLYDQLSVSKSMTFAAMRKLIFGKQSKDYRLNLEGMVPKGLPGNETNALFQDPANADLTGFWNGCSLERQSEIIDCVISDMDDAEATASLIKLGIPSETADRLLDLQLKEGYCHLSLKAMGKILPYLRQRLVYSEASARAGYKHSEEWNGEVFPDGNLPYYGEVLKGATVSANKSSRDDLAVKYGKINNPTVHVALNQLQKLVNALSQRYGAPRQIVLELGKDTTLSKKKIDELNAALNQNFKKNEEIRKFLDDHKQPWNRDNMLRVKLWLELGDDPLERRCVYSGKQISVTDLFSRAIEIDHILPFSRTYEDVNANKALCTHAANQYKGDRTPYEAFSKSADGYNWQDILSRAGKLSESKQRRFHSNAMERFSGEDDLLARMLNDTRYMSRVAMKYMWYVCGKNNVWTVNGKHTGLLRKKWGLDKAWGETDVKERSDHRHHAIDAFVIALTTRSLVKQIAERIARAQYGDRLILDAPYAGFNYEDFRSRVDAIMVSFKPDQISPARLQKRNQTGGSLMEETAYGFVKDADGNLKMDPDNPRQGLFTVRKAVTEITAKNWDSIALLDHDPRRKQLAEIAASSTGDQFKERVKQWARANNFKKVKFILSQNPNGMIPIRDRQGHVFKYMSSGSNLFADIYLPEPRDPQSKWGIEIVSSYDAHQSGFLPQWKKDHPKGKLIMRVFKNDVIALDGADGKREFRRLRKMTNGILFLRPLNIAKKDDGTGEQYSPRQLMQLRARKAGIDIIGRVYDPIVNKP